MMKSKTKPKAKRKPKFKICEIIRYAYGETALMRVVSISLDRESDILYHGSQCMGGVYSAFEKDCIAATTKDLKTYKNINKELR